jgi:hypothetical protein
VGKGGKTRFDLRPCATWWVKRGTAKQNELRRGWLKYGRGNRGIWETQEIAKFLVYFLIVFRRDNWVKNLKGVSDSAVISKGAIETRSNSKEWIYFFANNGKLPVIVCWWPPNSSRPPPLAQQERPFLLLATHCVQSKRQIDRNSFSISSGFEHMITLWSSLAIQWMSSNILFNSKSR